MGRPYANEMSELADTFSWAAKTDIEPLRRVIRTVGLSPLRAIGSGGSLTVGYALAGFHRRFAGRLGAVATPLEAINEPSDASVTTWLISTSGSNLDIIAAAKACAAREPRQLVVLCGRERSPLAKFCRSHPFIDLLLYPPLAGKDGFLATNSLLGFTTLLARAYALEFAQEPDWVAAVEAVRPLLSAGSETLATWEKSTSPLWERATTVVLHGPSTRIGAVDLESKFTEAALGNLQFADVRNFAHGRHHWLAKRGAESAVLAFVTDENRALADRTLALIPADIPRARLELAGSSLATALGALVAALRLTGWAGAARGIDPGRPGVPDFGCRLYRLSVRHPNRAGHIGNLTKRDAAAIERKSGMQIANLRAQGELGRWQQALDEFRNRLRDAQFAAVVLDYDGTVVDTRHRFEPAGEEMAVQLARIVEAGVWLAVATGRRTSVRRDLRMRLPEALWSHVLVGYCNGAEVATLDDDGAPDRTETLCEELEPLAAALRTQSELAHAASQEDQRFQITLRPKCTMPENRLWDLVQQMLLMTGRRDVTVTRSGHSVDILAPGVSKLNVLTRLRERVGTAPVLCIGDRGRWPGNDYELLREPFSLGVDEISVDPDTCWNLAPPGQRGTAVTLDYLQALEVAKGGLRFQPEAFR